MLVILVTQYKTKNYFNLVLQEVYISGNSSVNVKFSNEPIPYTILTKIHPHKLHFSLSCNSMLTCDEKWNMNCAIMSIQHKGGFEAIFKAVW